MDIRTPSAISSLAYFGVISPAYKEWETFGPEVLGLELVESGPDGAVRLRADEVAYRLAIHPGERNDVAYIGWSMLDERAARALVERVAAEDIEVRRSTEEENALRKVAGFYAFEDPSGFRHELGWGLTYSTKPFRSGRAISGFRTGDQGLGHVVLGVSDLARSDRFYREVMGFHPSDTVHEGPVKAHFYHVNGRHHSLAIACPPGGRTSFLHLMLEVNALDDVGTALDLCQQRGIPVTRTLGRHSNDHVISFYAYSPSTFRIEYGWGGMSVGDLWVPRSYDRASLWGHMNQHKELSPFMFIDRPGGRNAG